MRTIGLALFLSAFSTLCGAAAPDDLEPLRFFAASDPPPAPWPDRQRWPDRDDTVQILEKDDVNRWIAQARNGRAVAALRAGNMLRLWQKHHGGCGPALEMYAKALELGSPDAAASIGISHVSSDCPTQDPGAAIPWLKQGVELGSFLAAAKLARLLGDVQSPLHDPVAALLYAKVAQHDPESDESGHSLDVAALEAGVTDEQRAQAEMAANQLVEQLRAREKRFSPLPREERVAARELAGVAASMFAIDSLRECEKNLVGNCRGVRRLAQGELSNSSGEFQACELRLTTVHGATGKPFTLVREALVAPNATRRLTLGFMSGALAPRDFHASCKPVRHLAAQAARGACAAKPIGTLNLADVYPKASRNREEQGRAILYVLVRDSDEPPTHVELVRGTGFPALDAAAMEATRNRLFRHDCRDGIGYLRFGMDFKLSN